MELIFCHKNIDYIVDGDGDEGEGDAVKNNYAKIIISI